MITEELAQSMKRPTAEKTVIDKLLGKEDIKQMSEVIQKSEFDRTDIRKIKYLMHSAESKLHNYGENTYYIMNLFFVWISEEIKFYEIFFDYIDDLEKKEIKISNSMNELIHNVKRRMTHTCKYMIDVYTNIGRTTLSLGGTGFIQLLTNKFEMDYKNGMNPLSPVPTQQQSTGLFNRKQRSQYD